MSEKTFNNIRIIHKHDTEENWLKAENFIPKQGELIIYDIDNNNQSPRFKIGDGETNVNLLPFGIENQLNKNLGIENANKALTTDSYGNITTIGDAVNYFIIHATKNGMYNFPEDLSTSVVPKEDNADYYYITADKTYFEIVSAINNGLIPIMILDLGGIIKLTLNYTGYDSLSDFIPFTGNLTSWLDYPELKAFQHQRQITAYICPHEDTGSQYEINDDYIRIYSDSFSELYKKINEEITSTVSVQPDWKQNDPEGEGYIKNRTHYMTNGACYYSCNSYNEYAASADVVVEGFPLFVKVSDSLLTEEQLMEVETSITINDIYSEESVGLITLKGTEKEITVNDNMITAMYTPKIPENATEDEQDMAIYGTTYLISAKAGTVLTEEDGTAITIPEDGTYAINYLLMFISIMSQSTPEIVTIMGMIFNNWEVKYGEIKQLSTTYIPSTIARVGNVLTKAEGMIYLEELNSDLLSTINTKITTPSTGLVGQVLAVKTVDENGKPTEFETIDGTKSNDFFYVNCVSKVADFDSIIEDNVHFDITTDKTFSEIKAAVNEGKVPIAIFKWLNENNNDSVIDMLVFTDYGTDLDGDFIYFSSPTIDSAGIGKYLITICNPNPAYVHEITKDQISYKEVNVNMDDIDTLELITVEDIDIIWGQTIQMASEVKF